jgi:uncharacterized protein (TIGR00255 family)
MKEHILQLSSMTGFARIEGAWGNHRWAWELKSVNSRGLDIRHRLPSGMDAHERTVKSLVSGKLARGNVNCNLAIYSTALPARIQVNEEVLDDIVSVAKAEATKHGLEAPRISEIMALRGILEITDHVMEDDERQARDEAVLASLEAAVDELAMDRAREGAKMGAVISDQVNQIEALVARARLCAGGQAAAIQDRLEAQLSEALGSRGVKLDQDRLVHEVSILALKADITEELDRLEAHIGAARDLLATSDPVGRKLDFLAQEFGREANTLASKASDNELSSIGLDLKVIIDQIREQVQNIE